MQTDHQLTRLFRISLLFSLLITSLLATTPLDYRVVASGFGDKLEHLLAFLTLAFLADFSFPRQPWNRIKFISLLGYGLLLEIIQHFMPWRLFSIWDLAADALGLFVYPLLLPALKGIPWLAHRWAE